MLRLVNHATTTQELPWATPLNLRRAVEALAARMDRERDVLVLYMTSHGARDFKLAAAHWPLTGALADAAGSCATRSTRPASGTA